MRTIRTKVYKFNELSEQAKQTVIENNYDINLNHDWWEYMYTDAEEIGLKIDSFDIDRASYVKGEFIMSAFEVSAKIVQEHGTTCETYKTAVQFGIDLGAIKEKYKDSGEDNWDEQSEIEELEDEFLKSLCEDYRILLSKEYDYLTSKEAITETIILNEYEFTSNGKMI